VPVKEGKKREEGREEEASLIALHMVPRRKETPDPHMLGEKREKKRKGKRRTILAAARKEGPSHRASLPSLRTGK